MRRLRASFTFQVFLLIFWAAGSIASAQQKASKPEAPGWGSVWSEPVTEGQRRQKDFSVRYTRAMEAGNYREALRISADGLKAFPDDSLSFARRAVALGKLNRFAEAASDIEHGYRLSVASKNTQDQSAFLQERAEIATRQSAYASAISDLRAAANLTPNEPDYVNSLAWLRATCPKAEQRNGAEAVKLARKALSLHPGHEYAYLDTLAAAYAESNDFPRAVDTEKRALADARKTAVQDKRVVKFLQGGMERLKLFEKGQPYRHDFLED